MQALQAAARHSGGKLPFAETSVNKNVRRHLNERAVNTLETTG
jgi:hypothetical protein